MFSICSQPQLQGRATNTIRNLLSSHDSDDRYESPEARARVASLYIPLVHIVIDALPILNDFICAKCMNLIIFHLYRIP